MTMKSMQNAAKQSLIPRLQEIQGERGRVPWPRGSAGRFGFAFSSMDRPHYTSMTLASLDTEPGFDLVWVDGSRTEHCRQLVHEYPFRFTRKVESHLFVRGGPDRAIVFGLQRLLALGYDWCGLIENDLVFLPGWLTALKQTIDRAGEDGLAVGAASVLAYEGRMAEFRPGYSLGWSVGAAMVVFHREAARLIVDNYAALELTVGGMREFYRNLLGISLHPAQVYRAANIDPDRRLTVDWGYAPFLYQQGFVTVATVPARAYDLEFDVRRHLGDRYVISADAGAGLRTPFVE